MATFRLQVVSMDGLEYDGEVERIKLRTIHGDLAILARHMNYVTAIGMGTATVVFEDGTERKAACIGGMLSMMDNHCRVIPTTWEWGDEIDLERAMEAKKRAEERLQDSNLELVQRVNAEAKLYRALVRIGSAKK
ncbi:MAG: ATP synthase F1 subunit epsilon [Lachnospiraceae bacterium]|jgi:F-type H+-transporting ATPase subunit epsilon|nr:ATP synthase F1 subunit epsilon [Lachnospiraceae bacterium]